MEQIFKDIPKEFKIDALVHQNTYLIDGELKEWKGKKANVFSTISSTKEYQPTLLGTVPDLGEEEGLEALKSAEKAYDRGQGYGQL